MRLGLYKRPNIHVSFSPLLISDIAETTDDTCGSPGKHDFHVRFVCVRAICGASWSLELKYTCDTIQIFYFEPRSGRCAQRVNPIDMPFRIRGFTVLTPE